MCWSSYQGGECPSLVPLAPMVGGLTSPRHLDSWNLPAWGSNQLHTLRADVIVMAHLPPPMIRPRADVFDGGLFFDIWNWIFKFQSGSRVTSIKPDRAGGQTDTYKSIHIKMLDQWMDGRTDELVVTLLYTCPFIPLSLSPTRFTKRPSLTFQAQHFHDTRWHFAYHTPRDHPTIPFIFDLHVHLFNLSFFCFFFLTSRLVSMLEREANGYPIIYKFWTCKN